MSQLRWYKGSIFTKTVKILFLGSSCQGVTWQCSKIEIDLCNMGLLFGVNPISFFLILTTSLTKSKLKQKERLLFVCLFFKYNVEAYIFTLQRCFKWKKLYRKTIKVQQTKPVSLEKGFLLTNNLPIFLWELFCFLLSSLPCLISFCAKIDFTSKLNKNALKFLFLF